MWLSAAVLLAAAIVAPPVGGQKVDAFMGDWEGTLSLGGTESSRIAAQVIARGKGRYRANLLPEFDRRVEPLAVLEGRDVDGAVEFDPAGNDTKWSGRLDGVEFSGRVEGAQRGSFSLKPVVRLSPTLGRKPPPGAVVLLDGSGTDGWVHAGNGQPCKWKLLEDGALEVVPRTGSIVSKRQFRDHHLHIEFRGPFMPAARGQKRGNSGVYLQGFYEVQVLDSYGLEGRDNECGGIYKVAAPLVNMCAPPMQWQTYDIDFTAPRFDKTGRMTAHALMTVVHNGVEIHDNLEVPRPTAAHGAGDLAQPGGLYLQDHGNRVQYRNIWVVEE